MYFGQKGQLCFGKIKCSLKIGLHLRFQMIIACT